MVSIIHIHTVVHSTGSSSRSSQFTALLVPESHSDSLDQVGEHLLSSGKKWEEWGCSEARPCGGARGWDTTDELCSSQWEGGDCLPWPRCRGQLWSAPQSLLLSTYTSYQWSSQYWAAAAAGLKSGFIWTSFSSIGWLVIWYQANFILTLVWAEQEQSFSEEKFRVSITSLSDELFLSNCDVSSRHTQADSLIID